MLYRGYLDFIVLNGKNPNILFENMGLIEDYIEEGNKTQ